MKDPPQVRSRTNLPPSVERRLDEICVAFEQAWRSERERGPRLEEFLDPTLPREPQLERLLAIERAQIETPRMVKVEDYISRFPNDQDIIGRIFPTPAGIDTDAATLDPTDPDADTLGVDAMKQRDAISASTFGDYEILGQIGEGGMGVVYKARQTPMNRLVALKMINIGRFAGAQAIARFYSEARSAGKLDHPGIVPVYEVGEHEGTHFYSMAFVEGRSLANVEAPMPSRRAAELVVEAAKAVHHAHEQRILHRDIKPQNIILDTEGLPRVTDFGLAKRLDYESEWTATGQAIGTPSYMAPEQARGDKAADQRADVYALGATLYYLLTGRPPHRGASQAETLRQVLEDGPVTPRRLVSTIPRDLETICLKCLRKERGGRYETANALAEDLARWLENKPIVARRVSVVEKAWLLCKRRPVPAGLVAALLVGLMVGAWIFNESQNATHAKGLVDAIVKADVDEAPSIAAEIERYRRWSEPVLRARIADAKEGSVAQLQLRMALLKFDTGQVQPLFDAFLIRETRFLNAICEVLKPYGTAVSESFWKVLHGNHEDARRFNAGIGLAQHAPDDDRWSDRDGEFLAREFIRADNEQWPRLRELLAPIKRKLMEPLEKAFADPGLPARERLGAAHALAKYAADDGPRLARLLSVATPAQYGILFAPLKRAGDASGELRKIAAARASPRLSEPDRVSWGQRGARAAAAALRLGDPRAVIEAMKAREDPESTTQFAARAREWGVTATQVLESLDLVDELRAGKRGDERRSLDPVVHGLLLSLGEFSLSDLPRARRLAFADDLVRRYAEDPSSAVHGAAGWLLRHWGFEEQVQRVNKTPLEFDASGERDWFVQRIRAARDQEGNPLESSQDLHFTFVVFPPGEFVMGPGRRVKLTRPIAISDRETTWSQFRPFDRGKRHDSDATRFKRSLGGDDPVFGVTWLESVLYCRWLNHEAGVPDDEQCCQFNPGTMKGAVDLQGRGFRPPTEAEWEYACRGGAVTCFSFGSDRALLARYAWFEDNSGDWSHAVARLRPNPRGLFDVHGNLFEWVLDWSDPEGEHLPGAMQDAATARLVVDPAGPRTGTRRVIRGGGYFYRARYCQSTSRIGVEPLRSRANITGFRLATVPTTWPR